MKRAPHRAVTIRGERQFDGPLMAPRRCDDRHIKQARPAGEKGGSGTLVMKLGFYYLANFYRLVAGDVMDIMYRAPWIRVPLVIVLFYVSILFFYT